jgi:hypothetical protein
MVLDPLSATKERGTSAQTKNHWVQDRVLPRRSRARPEPRRREPAHASARPSPAPRPLATKSHPLAQAESGDNGAVAIHNQKSLGAATVLVVKRDFGTKHSNEFDA